MERECLRHLADLRVVFEVKGGCVRSRLPHPPRAHQSMLETRQLILLVAKIVQQPLQEPRRELTTGDANRALDCDLELIAVESGDQILATIHHFRETVEARTVANKIRAHRGDDIDRHLGLGASFA